MECVLLETAYSTTNGNDDRLLTIARRYRIDVDKIVRSVRDEFAAKAKKAGSKPAKAPSRPIVAVAAG